ncbi:MAG TPA: glycerol-3-phosphate acyltransferase [Candidatus Gallacutalibacter stercoravium]|nr:glycerol-3-phosphate acyltransferase [Candidatus Gallacutalibacter stercoravium]
MEALLYIAAAVCAYLVAGINPAIEISKRIYHKDIRTCGSGNPGFTNFKRTFGNKWAWWVLLFDLCKGAIVTAVFAYLFTAFIGNYQFGAAYTGLFALLGHAYPIWYKFQGGKGFLVYMSVIWFIDWHTGLIALTIMLVLLALTKYMSLSTVVAMLSCPITLVVRQAPVSVVLLCTASVLYIALRHKENFKRLAKGTESKFSLKGKTVHS